MKSDRSLSPKPTLDPVHADVIRATLPVIGANIDAITRTFYGRLFAAHPTLQTDLFNRGNQAQGSQQRALAASIATFATHLIDPSLPNPADMLGRIGNKHASLGVTADQYEVVHEHLFGAIVEVLGANVVTPAIAEAWDRVYWLMADLLIDFEKQLYVDSAVEPGDVFRRAVVTSRSDDPAGAVVVTIESADPSCPLPDFDAGQYISVGVPLEDGARQLRQYSLINAATGDGRYTFAARRVGEVSDWLGTHATPGTEVDVTLPFGDLVVDDDDRGPLVLISAGIGVTPIAGILAHLAAHDCERSVWVVHADTAPETHPLRDRMLELMEDLPNATVEFWYDSSGAGALDVRSLGLPRTAQYYLCGGPGFLQHVRGQLLDMGVPAEAAHFELFSPNDWLLN
ncbi:MAG: globin domain-containing protein [Nocardiaceae bacterium]|nr:globin domain-containing protein [Nocardiaceae bacterium]